MIIIPNNAILSESLNSSHVGFRDTSITLLKDEDIFLKNMFPLIILVELIMLFEYEVYFLLVSRLQI